MGPQERGPTPWSKPRQGHTLSAWCSPRRFRIIAYEKLENLANHLAAVFLTTARTTTKNQAKNVFSRVGARTELISLEALLYSHTTIRRCFAANGLQKKRTCVGQKTDARMAHVRQKQVSREPPANSPRVYLSLQQFDLRLQSFLLRAMAPSKYVDLPHEPVRLADKVHHLHPVKHHLGIDESLGCKLMLREKGKVSNTKTKQGAQGVKSKREIIGECWCRVKVRPSCFTVSRARHTRWMGCPFQRSPQNKTGWAKILTFSMKKSRSFKYRLAKA